MKIAVVCANGKAGQLIVREAVNRGFDVTAFVRGENKSDAPNAVIKDLFKITKDDLAPFDAVIDAAGAWTPDTVHIVPDAVKYLADLLRGTDTRLLVVGGAGSLFVDKEHTKTVFDVTAVVRGDNKSAAQSVIAKDLFDLTAADLAGFDA